ncbi:MAG: ornithine carbamoyltransferase [Planctomycetota bacterium]
MATMTTGEIKPAGATIGAPITQAAPTLNGLLGIDGLSAEQLRGLLTLAAAVKADPSAYAGRLSDLSVTMLFEKPSLRTRMSFEIGLTKLGMHAVYYDHGAQRIGERECVKDYALNLERWTDAIVARVYDHRVLEQMAQHASVPIVNALSDVEHPCQALADMLTIGERFGRAPGDLSGLKMAWIGDGNNVCHSLMLASAKLGMSFTAITPKGFEPQFSVLQKAMRAGEQTGATIALGRGLDDLRGHHAVYTDTWVSMGQESQNGLRADAFTGYTVDAEVMAVAGDGLDDPEGIGSAFMHCLPAHRGEEVTDEVIDSGASVVYDQAENRMHAQNALFLKLFGKG